MLYCTGMPNLSHAALQSGVGGVHSAPPIDLTVQSPLEIGPVADLRKAQATPSIPRGPNFFNFMQVSGKMCLNNRLAPLPVGLTPLPPQGKFWIHHRGQTSLYRTRCQLHAVGKPHTGRHSCSIFARFFRYGILFSKLFQLSTLFSIKCIA